MAFHSLLRWKIIMLPILTTSLIHFSLTLSTPKSDQFQISPAAPPEFRIVFDRHTHKRTPKNAEYVWTVAVFGEKKYVFENSCVGVDKAHSSVTPSRVICQFRSWKWTLTLECWSVYFGRHSFEFHLSVPEWRANNVGGMNSLRAFLSVVGPFGFHLMVQEFEVDDSNYSARF